MRSTAFNSATRYRPASFCRTTPRSPTRATICSTVRSTSPSIETKLAPRNRIKTFGLRRRLLVYSQEARAAIGATRLAPVRIERKLAKRVQQQTSGQNLLKILNAIAPTDSIASPCHCRHRHRHRHQRPSSFRSKIFVCFAFAESRFSQPYPESRLRDVHRLRSLHRHAGARHTQLPLVSATGRHGWQRFLRRSERNVQSSTDRCWRRLSNECTGIVIFRVFFVSFA